MPPTNQLGDDSRPEIRPVYCYLIQQLDQENAPTLCLTSHDGDIEIAGLPARYGAEEPQSFMPANIGHGAIRREGNFDKSTFEIRALTRDIGGISRYALTGLIPRVQIDIVKINPGRIANGLVANWGEDTATIQTGLISSLSFQGFTIVVECVPEPLFSGHEIPRWRFSRICNHQLYGPGCGVTQATFSLASTIYAVDPTARLLTINHTTGAADHFRQGVLLHAASGLRIPIFSSIPDGAKTVLRLGQWMPDLQIDDEVTVSAGCDHTFSTCKVKFSNAKNFGGFSEVPNKNPSAHGV